MNKIKIILTVLSIMLFTSISSVLADQVVVTETETGYYYYRKVGNSYTTGKWISYSVEDRVLYCISPYITSISTYTTGDFSKINLSDEVKNKILLIAYYGYDYKNHQTLKFRAATQALIWEEILGSNSVVEFFTEENRNGEILDIEKEKEEINNLINNHYLLPSFANQKYNININNEFQLIDENNVLNRYKIINSENLEVIIEDNILKVRSNKLESSNIELEKIQYPDRTYAVYYSTNSKNFISSGIIDKLTTNLEFITEGGTLTINKIDKKTNSKTVTGQGTLGNAKYGIYDSNDILISELVTDNNGDAVSNIINKFGTYYLKEITPSEGYKIDNGKYYFTIDEDNRNINITLKSEAIEKTITINKVYKNDNDTITNNQIIEFAFYDNNDNLYIKKETDEAGSLEITLPYGTYRVEQLTETEKYKKAEDITITIDELTSNLNLVFEDKLIKFYLKITTIDYSGNNIIQSGITYKIYDIDNNQYICDDGICEFSTDSNGIYLTNIKLNAGNYKIEEVSKYTLGYAWNDKPLEFSVTRIDNLINDTYEVKFQKQQVLGTLSIYKYGEELIIEDESFKYNTVPLEGVVYKIYDETHCIREIATNKRGGITLYGMQPKKYYVVESSTIGDYILDETIYEVDLSYVDQYTKTVSKSLILTSYLKKGNLEYTKIDTTTSNGLKDTLIEVYTINDELIYKGKTDDEGNITIENLKSGNYYIIEKEVPSGYIRNDEKIYFEINDNQTSVLKISNELVLTDVPSTGIYKFPLVQISSILVFIVAMFYEKKD